MVLESHPPHKIVNLLFTFTTQVPEQAWGHERVVMAKVVAIQEVASVSPFETPAVPPFPQSCWSSS